MTEIYVDGCGHGAGLFHDNVGYYFRNPKAKSANDNEMLGLILGLKYAIYHKLNAKICTDSEISLKIIDRNFSPQEHLNLKSFIFNKLLQKAEKIGLKIELQWIEGKSNPADAPSRNKKKPEPGWDYKFSAVPFN